MCRGLSELSPAPRLTGNRLPKGYFLLLHRRRGHSDVCGAKKLSLRTKIPVEHGKTHALASVAAINQWVTHGELHPAIRPGLGVRPSGSVAIARPHRRVGELRFG